VGLSMRSDIIGSKLSYHKHAGSSSSIIAELSERRNR
jgi:hypothetical protein